MIVAFPCAGTIDIAAKKYDDRKANFNVLIRLKQEPYRGESAGPLILSAVDLILTTASLIFKLQVKQWRLIKYSAKQLDLVFGNSYCLTLWPLHCRFQSMSWAINVCHNVCTSHCVIRKHFASLHIIFVSGFFVCCFVIGCFARCVTGKGVIRQKRQNHHFIN